MTLYQEVIPPNFRREQPQTCVAAILAYHKKTDSMNILAMGVGTKFLSNEVLKREEDEGNSCYGQRVRDCHAEVLARRAFQRYIALEIKNDLLVPTKCRQSADTSRECTTILERRYLPNQQTTGFGNSFVYRLRNGVTLHFYTSSAPCGNAVLKKFATFSKEIYREELSPSCWPCERHLPPLSGSAIAKGEFALLVKKDSTATAVSDKECIHSTNHGMTSSIVKQQQWPVNCSTRWCPPGTTTVWSGLGRIHTCSDKLCLWNVLGVQGSLLSSLFLAQCKGVDTLDNNNEATKHDEWRLLFATITVGRKHSAITCRRAICCRIQADSDTDNDDHDDALIQDQSSNTRNTNDGDSSRSSTKQRRSHSRKRWTLGFDTMHHPIIMSTGVYLDEYGVIDMNVSSSKDSGQDVRFHSSLSWVWWKEHDTVSPVKGVLECINGSSGWRVPTCNTEPSRPQTNADEERSDDISSTRESPNANLRSLVCSAALLELFAEIRGIVTNYNVSSRSITMSLRELRRLKMDTSPLYEERKQTILATHPVLRQWKRRGGKMSVVEDTG